jgi:hypothetical protein
LSAQIGTCSKSRSRLACEIAVVKELLKNDLAPYNRLIRTETNLYYKISIIRPRTVTSLTQLDYEIFLTVKNFFNKNPIKILWVKLPSNKSRRQTHHILPVLPGFSGS